MYQLNSGGLPDVFSSMFVKNTEVHSYPTRQKDSFHLSPVRTVSALKTITTTGPKFWNELDREIIQSQSLYSFKHKLKLVFLNSYL